MLGNFCISNLSIFRQVKLIKKKAVLNFREIENQSSPSKMPATNLGRTPTRDYQSQNLQHHARKKFDLNVFIENDREKF